MSNIDFSQPLTISKYVPPNPNFDPVEIKRNSEGDYCYNDNIVNFIYHDVINSSLPKTYDGVINKLVIECVLHESTLTYYLNIRGISITVDKNRAVFHETL